MSAKRRSGARSGARATASGGRQKGGRTSHAAPRDAALAADASEPVGTADRFARWLLFALVLAPPFLISATADDAFRLPKTAAAEGLALCSLLAIAIGWWSRRDAVSLADLARRPATAFAALLAAAALPGALFAVHPEHWRRAAVSLTIALLCLVLWSAKVGERTLRRALDLLVVPAAGLALLAILQVHRIFRPFAFAQGQALRYQLTSLAGSVGDLAAFLVLPALLLQAAVLRAKTKATRVASGALLVVVAYALLRSETLAALLAITVASLLFWTLVLPRRRRWWVALPLVLVGLGAVLMPGLDRRLEAKVRDVRDGSYDALLSGRPDGWKASLEMFREHPWFGVGHGGYSASFAPAKLALTERGARFWGRGRTAFFANAHNDYLEALAEWGLWGAAALAAALALLARRLRRFARDAVDGADAAGADRADAFATAERALAFAGCAACAVLALASFPLRIALTAYPWLLFASWLFAGPNPRATDGAPAATGTESAAGGARVLVPARAWSLALVVVLLPAVAVHVLSLLGRLEASRIVRTTGQVAQLALQHGQAAAVPVLQANLQPLKRAAELDPLAIGVPLTTGSHYLLLGNGDAAIESYEHGLAIEPRAEIYFNLARALLFAGRRDESSQRAATALILDPQLEDDAVALGLVEARPNTPEKNTSERSGSRRRSRR